MTHAAAVRRAAAALVAALGLAALPGVSTAADMLLLQQTLPPGTEGTTDVMIDRERVAAVRVEQEDDGSRVQVTLDPEGELRLRCADLAAARQVLEALRPGNGLASLDLTGRCRL